MQAEIDGKRRLYEDFARTVPRGRVVPVDAGHLTIHLRHPDVVAQAISDVLAQAAQQS